MALVAQLLRVVQLDGEEVKCIHVLYTEQCTVDGEES